MRARVNEPSDRHEGAPTGPPAADRLTRLLRPRSIAVVGGRSAAEVIKQCERLGFHGDLWPVHPTRGDVAGRPAFGSIAELPHAPDAAFVAVNRHATVETVAELAQLGAGGAVCYASGFLETEDGEALQSALVAAAGDMPIVGPNCYGLINFLDAAPLWPDQHGGRRLGPDERGVAIVTQSSNIAVSLTMQQRGLPLAYVVTAGNQAQLGVSTLAAALLDDERVSALGLHVEGFDSVTGFEGLAMKARQRRVPVAVMKTGRSDRGRAAALSHTASIAGSDAGAGAFLRRLGFARVHGITELLETLKLLHVHGALDGTGIGAMCCSGGEASVIADAVEETALTCPGLQSDHAAAVATTVHPLVTVANPLDYHTFSWGDEAALTNTFTAFARGGFNLSLLVLDFPRGDRCRDDDWWVALRAFDNAVARAQVKGAIIATMPENLPEATAVHLVERGVAPLAGVREALRAIECAASIGAGWQTPQSDPLIPNRCVAGEPVVLDEATAKARLAAYGVAVPIGQVAHSADQALAIATAIGGPVAIKALGISHKTEQQAVRLGLTEPGEIRAAAVELLALPRESAAPCAASVSGGNARSAESPEVQDAAVLARRSVESGNLSTAASLLVERFESGMVTELIVGLHRDPQLGLLLTLGSGGTLVEIIADPVTLLLPVTETEVKNALSELKCAPLLAGYRGDEPADVDAAVTAVLAIAKFAVAHADRLEELDINPLGVGPHGRGALALDALIRIRETQAGGKS